MLATLSSACTRRQIAAAAAAVASTSLASQVSASTLTSTTASTAASTATSTTAPGADASLTDGAGRFVVDKTAAAAGLEDPLAEPIGAYSSIGAALAVAPSGATIVLRPGTYVERLAITRSVHLIADPGTLLTWTSDKPYEAAVTVDLTGPQSTGPQATSTPRAGTSAACNVIISGLTVRHFSPSIAQNYAIYVPQPAAELNRNSRIELRGCDISSTSGSGVGVEGGDVSLTACRIANCKNHGVVYLGPTARGVVSECVVEKCKLNGVLLRDGAAARLSANQLNANGQFGAALIDCRGVYAPSNLASGNGKGKVSGQCDADDQDGLVDATQA